MFTNRSFFNRRIRDATPDYPDCISGSTKDFIAKLLIKTPDDRLGSSPTGACDIKSHPYFEVSHCSIILICTFFLCGDYFKNYVNKCCNV